MTDKPTSDVKYNDDPPYTIDVAPRVKRLPPYLFGRINKLKYQKRRAGADVIDLGMGNPSDPPQDLVIDKLSEAAHDPDNHGYSNSIGILNLPECRFGRDGGSTSESSEVFMPDASATAWR